MLPQDSFILLSYINTKLRDEYSSIEELCEDLACDCAQLEQKLGALGYVYNREQNKFC